MHLYANKTRAQSRLIYMYIYSSGVKTWDTFRKRNISSKMMVRPRLLCLTTGLFYICGSSRIMNNTDNSKENVELLLDITKKQKDAIFFYLSLVMFIYNILGDDIYFFFFILINVRDNCNLYIIKYNLKLYLYS